jgi:ABC-type multidrug transport system ATPase subunit
MVAYVAQYNLPFIGLTVKEILIYHALLNVAGRYDYAEVANRVGYILELMGLQEVSNQIVTEDSQGGLSGGQRRKLAISLALIKRPSVIILDEPTSGLDSHATLEIVKLLNNLKDYGYTIVSTIHQPRQEVFDYFTHVVVMGKGRTLFCGPRVLAVAAFLDQNPALKIYNTCDSIVDAVSMMSSNELHEKVYYQKPAEITLSAEARAVGQLKKSKVSTHTILNQVVILNSRYWTTRPYSGKISMSVIAFLTALVFGSLQYREEQDVTAMSLTIKGLIISCLGLSALKNINFSFDFYSDLDFYNFDILNGNIHHAAYFIHRLILETATCTIESVISGTCTYIILNSPPLESAGSTVILLIIVYYNCMVSFFALIYSSNLERGHARSVSFFVQCILGIASGLWIKKGETNLYDLISWVEIASPNYWVMSPLISSVLNGVGECVVIIDGVCRAKMGDVLIQQGGLDNVNPNTAIIAMVILLVCIRSVQYFVLTRNSS